jgi:adenylate cyclase
VESGFPDELFEGLSGQQREERLALLSWLREKGVELAEMTKAVRAGNLALLPTELLLTSDCRYTLPDAARETGLSQEFIARAWRAAGIAVPTDGEPVLDEEDLDAVKFARQVLDAGFSEEAYIEISRVVGRGAAPTAETLVQVSVERFLEPSPNETEFAMRLHETAEQLAPLLPFLLAFPVRMHLRSAVRNHALERQGQNLMALSGTRHMAVGFADMVGFTARSEGISVAESGALASVLERLASTVAEPPVRLVKLIGDAAMLISDEPRGLVAALVKLRDLSEDETEFPALRMGVASGEVAARAGDVYGPAVNLASRLADLAQPGQLLGCAELPDLLDDSYELRPQPASEIKGIGRYRPVEIVAASEADGSR